MKNEANIRVVGLTKLAQLQLRQEFEAAGQTDTLKFEPDDIGGAHGEVATATAIVLLGAAALSTLAVWLCRSSKTETYERELLICDEEGNVLRAERVKITTTQSAAPNPEVLKELARIGKIDVKELLEHSPSE